MSNEQVDFSLWANFDNWSLKDALFIIKTYVKERAIARGDNEDDIKRKQSYVYRKFDRGFDEFTDDVKYRIEYDEEGHEVIVGDGDVSEVVDYSASIVNKASFIKWAYRERIPLPDVIMNIVKNNKNMPAPSPENEAAALTKKETAALAELPSLRKQVSELSAEKDKWDASIEAATKIGLLFFENGIEKPISKVAFINEFAEHIGSGLHDSTIERIYKSLPTEYRQKGGRPKKTKSGNNVVDVAAIKAAVYAGSIFETDNAKSLNKLKRSLKEGEYEIPADDILKIIISEVNDL